MNKELEALENIKHYDSRVGLHESDYDIIETALKTNNKKLNLIGEILVDISKGNYADLNTAIDEIREVLK